jgi:hypothetical protein
MSRRWVVLGTGALALLGMAAAMTRPRIVVLNDLPNGTRLAVFQQFNDPTEPFETSVFSNRGSGWGWFYFDHQNTFWLAGRIEIDSSSQTALIYRGEQAVARYNWTNDKLTHLAKGTESSPELVPDSPHATRRLESFGSLLRADRGRGEGR